MPNTAELAYLLILVGPGFVLMQLRAWTSEDHPMSDAQRLTWSVLLALPLFFGLHSVVRAFPWKFGDLEPAPALLSDPFSAPYQFVLALYALAAVVGWAVGRLQDKQPAILWNSLRRLRLDPARHRDVWRAALKEENTVVLIQLTDGTALYGWPEEHSSGIHDAKRYIRLNNVSKRRAGDTWIELPKREVLLVCTESISYMHVRPYVPRDGGTSPESLELNPSSAESLEVS